MGLPPTAPRQSAKLHSDRRAQVVVPPSREGKGAGRALRSGLTPDPIQWLVVWVMKGAELAITGFPCDSGHMATIRAQIQLPYTTGIPSDVSTNTLHFVLPDPVVALDYELLANAISAIFGWPTGGFTVGSSIGAAVTRAADGCSIDFYDLADPTPRVPRATELFTMPDATSGVTDLPHEAACCLSYRATYLSGVSRARQRGRNYIGPFQINANTNGRPTTQIRASIRGGYQRMVTMLDAIDAVWVVRSEVSNTNHTVAALWTDNAWDTQRRRGVAPTDRQNEVVVQ
uniref:Uncharacterized protein n=1 Tax=uncultured prokaryote TaxID=198431 RepID=A0A0H5Q439_9ZZZZ|nr:hypothetical protein [uncultured prokaryote]